MKRLLLFILAALVVSGTAIGQERVQTLPGAIVYANPNTALGPVDAGMIGTVARVRERKSTVWKEVNFDNPSVTDGWLVESDLEPAREVPPPPPPPPPVVADSIAFPIEVMAPGDTTITVRVKVLPGKAASLYLRTHSATYEPTRAYGRRKAGVRINNGPWVDITNTNVSCLSEQELLMLCVDGPYATLSFTIGTDLLGEPVEGNNDISLRFQYVHPDVSSGYRVLDLDVLDFTGQSIVDRSGFVAPEAPPAKASPADQVARGRALYDQRGWLTDGPSGPVIKAACADCHVAGGYDLRYFGYTENAIKVRGAFHGLSKQEAEDIAAFVMSLPIEPVGKPWDPPYQPGMRLDMRPANDWAAGAGLGSVLPHDSLMAKHLFPGGVEMDPFGRINRREIPIAIQLPDWNEWLPTRHPIDTWGDEFEQGPAWASYVALYERWGNPATLADDIAKRRLPRQMEGMFDAFKDFVRAKQESAGNSGTLRDLDVGIQQMDLYRLAAVKTFELMQVYSLNETPVTLYPNEGEARGWFSVARTLFNNAPHISGSGKGDVGTCYKQYFDVAWYGLQSVVNAGNRQGSGMKPADWKYTYGHIRDLKKACGYAMPYLYTAEYLTAIQNGTNDAKPGTSDGFYLRHTHPIQVVGHAFKSGGTPYDKNPFGELPLSVRRDIAAATIAGVGRYLTAHPPSEWARSSGLEAIEPATHVPAPCKLSSDPTDGTEYAYQFGCTIEAAVILGVDTESLTPLLAWLNQAWPLYNWNALTE